MPGKSFITSLYQWAIDRRTFWDPQRDLIEAVHHPEGDFAEFGCYAGASARILLDVVPLGERRMYLYDLFETPPGVHAMPGHGPDLHAEVRRLFPEPNVQVIKGLIPDSFAQGLPEALAFAHIDLNNAAAEIATLDAIEARLVTGAVLVFDDFGQLPFRDTHEAETAWFARRGIPVLEIPTGQGVVIWPGPPR